MTAFRNGTQPQRGLVERPICIAQAVPCLLPARSFYLIITKRRGEYPQAIRPAQQSGRQELRWRDVRTLYLCDSLPTVAVFAPFVGSAGKRVLGCRGMFVFAFCDERIREQRAGVEAGVGPGLSHRSRQDRTRVRGYLVRAVRTCEGGFLGRVGRF